MVENMNTSSKVSVVIPSYNHSKYITQTISSVIRQTHKNIEVIVIDDGSSDNSCDLIRKISDPRIIFLEQNNQGAHAAINRGLSMASGDFIAILNSDDIFAVNRIETCVSYTSKLTNNCLICSYIEVIDSKDNPLGIKNGFANMLPCNVDNPTNTFLSSNDPIENLLMFNYVATTSNFFFNRSFIDKVGFFSNLRYVHDWDYLLRIAKDYPICIIPEVLLKYRVHPTNTIKENYSRMILEICWILAKNYPSILPSITTKKSTDSDRFQFYERLYNSIQVYDCEKILLNMMLIFFACSNNPALSDWDDILNPDHRLHQSLIEKIEDIVEPRDENKLIPKKSHETKLQTLKKILFGNQ